MSFEPSENDITLNKVVPAHQEISSQGLNSRPSWAVCWFIPDIIDNNSFYGREEETGSCCIFSNIDYIEAVETGATSSAIYSRNLDSRPSWAVCRIILDSKKLEPFYKYCVSIPAVWNNILSQFLSKAYFNGEWQIFKRILKNENMDQFMDTNVNTNAVKLIRNILM